MDGILQMPNNSAKLFDVEGLVVLITGGGTGMLVMHVTAYTSCSIFV